MSDSVQRLIQALSERLGAVVFGLDEVVHGIGLALIARGHVLVQGAPGLGKTLMSKTLAQALGGQFKRIQGTADLMPADITGVHVYDAQRTEFVFKPGPLFADVLLVDEINRAGPKTQSALLEAMEERQVTVDRQNFKLPEDFLVIATQNPREFEGTYPLPESQLDRFMLRIDLGYPSRQAEGQVIDAYGSTPATPTGAAVPAVIDAALLAAARGEAARLHVSAALGDYVLDLAQASRVHPQVALGLSTRGVLALVRCARVEAAGRGADYVTPDDVRRVAPLVMAHRLVLTPESALEGTSEPQVVSELLETVTVPH